MKDFGGGVASVKVLENGRFHSGGFEGVIGSAGEDRSKTEFSMTANNADR